MDKNKLLRMFGEIDDKYIEQANAQLAEWEKAQQGMSLSNDYTRKSPWKAIIAAIASAAAVLFGAFIIRGFISGNGITPNDSGKNSSDATNDPGYDMMSLSMEYPTYESAKELIEASDMVFIGKAKSIGYSFYDIETGQKLPENSGFPEMFETRWYCDVDVITAYKGIDSKEIRVRADMGAMYKELDGKPMGSATVHFHSDSSGRTPLCVVFDSRIDLLGGEYLFCLKESEGGEAYIFNPQESILEINKPYSSIFGFPFRDLIKYFGEDKWEEFVEYVKIFEYETSDAVYEKNILVDWVVYNDLNTLINVADSIARGRVIGIWFELYDFKTGKKFSESSNPEDCIIYTVYTIEVQSTYKGGTSASINLRVPGGLKDSYVDEQLYVLGRNGMKPVITLFDDAPTINLDEEYLFVMSGFGGEERTISGFYQSVYPLSDPEEKILGNSAKDIISYFGEDKWEEYVSGELDKYDEEFYNYFEKLNKQNRELWESLDKSTWQTIKEDFDGIEITVTTDKREYKLDDTIRIRATLKNNTGKNIYIFHTGNYYYNYPVQFYSYIRKKDEGNYILDEYISHNYSHYSKTIVIKPGEEFSDYHEYKTYHPIQNTAFSELADKGVYNGDCSISVWESLNKDIYESLSVSFSIKLV